MGRGKQKSSHDVPEYISEEIDDNLPIKRMSN
jgi:hypothetical protein